MMIIPLLCLAASPLSFPLSSWTWLNKVKEKDQYSRLDELSFTSTTRSHSLLASPTFTLHETNCQRFFFINLFFPLSYFFFHSVIGYRVLIEGIDSPSLHSVNRGREYRIPVRSYRFRFSLSSSFLPACSVSPFLSSFVFLSLFLLPRWIRSVR